MKKTIVTLLAFLSLSAAARAQGFYFRAGLGYAVPMAGQSIDGEGAVISGSVTRSTYLTNFSSKNASFAAGLHGGVGLGYLFSKNIGVQLDVDANIAAKSYSFLQPNVYIDLGAGPILSNYTIKQQADLPILLTPKLALQTGGEKLNIYTNIGPAIPIIAHVLEDEIIDYLVGSPTSYTFTSTVKMRFSVGISGAAGVQYKINKKVSIWGEVSMLSMSLYKKQADLTGFQVNGQNQSLSSVGGATTIYYVKNGSMDTNRTTRPSYSVPFSNVGFNVGLRVALGKGSKNSGRRSGSRETAAPADNSGDMSRRPKAGRFR